MTAEAGLARPQATQAQLPCLCHARNEGHWHIRHHSPQTCPGPPCFTIGKVVYPLRYHPQPLTQAAQVSVPVAQGHAEDPGTTVFNGVAVVSSEQDQSQGKDLHLCLTCKPGLLLGQQGHCSRPAPFTAVKRHHGCCNFSKRELFPGAAYSLEGVSISAITVGSVRACR